MLRFAVVGLDHGHIYSHVEGLLAEGCEFVGYCPISYTPDMLEQFQANYPDVPQIDRSAIFANPDIEVICTAAVANQRAEIAIRAMRSGKDAMIDKPGVTTRLQLEEARKAHKETSKFFSICFSERLCVPSAVKAGKLIKEGAIGRVIQTIGLGPHQKHQKAGGPGRPDWFWDMPSVGGILVDIASHQIDQFLYYTGSDVAKVTLSQVGNFNTPEHPSFEDFGDMQLLSDKATGYIRVDWHTPDGLGKWGDGRLLIMGTEGYIELRKYIDIAGREGSDHLFLVNGTETRHIDCSAEPLDYFRQFVDDVQSRTQTALNQEHVFEVCRLSLDAQENAQVIAQRSDKVMSKIYRIAIVGAGIAEQQAQGLSWLKDKFEMVQLCSLDRERGERVCETHGIPEYGQDFDALLSRDDIDIISICTPPHLHYDMTEKVLRAGKHAVCEKPLFGSLAECDRMEELSASTGKIVMPIFQYRYGKGLQKLKRLVDEGLAGRPFMTTIETHWWRPKPYFDVEWRGKWATELGGGFLGHAIHAHDMLTYIHGPVAEVSAMGGPLMNDIQVEDNMVASVRMKNGSYAALSMSLSSRKEISRLRWCFEDLTVESDLSPYTMYREPWVFTGKDEAHQKRIDELLAEYAHHEDGYSRQYELLHAALEKGTTPPVTIADGRVAIELVAAAYLSERTGQRVTLPIKPDQPIYHGWDPARTGG